MKRLITSAIPFILILAVMVIVNNANIKVFAAEKERLAELAQIPDMSVESVLENHFKVEKLYKEYQMIVTAYSLDFYSCGKLPSHPLYAVTASTKKINRDIFESDGIIAAPVEFPFGTIMEVEGWGTGTVYDRGAAIKWEEKKGMYHIDLYFESQKEALEWGVKVLNVKVYEVIDKKGE